MDVCPTDVVFAPADRVWTLLTEPPKLANWTGISLLEGPTGSMRVGDHLVLGRAGLRIAFDVIDMRTSRLLVLDSRLPFGVTNHEQIQIAPIDAHSSRVTFN